MATQTSALNDAIVALITTLRAATGFKNPSESGSDVPVFDGAIVSEAQYPDGALVVGGDEDPEFKSEAATFQQEFRDFDGSRTEVGEITCAINVWSGDSALTTCRATAFDILADVEAALRPDTDAFDMGVTRIQWVEIDGGSLKQYFTIEGVNVEVVFKVRYQALLTVT